MEQQEVQTGSPAASSSTISNRGSPSTLATSPTLSPPKSPELGYRQSLSPSTTAGESPLPPLPAEVYLTIISFLPTSHIPGLLLVSKSWKSCLESEPSLWPNLSVTLDYDQIARNEFYAKRSSVNAGRFGAGGIRYLKISTLTRRSQSLYHDDTIDPQTMGHRLEHLYSILPSACLSRPYRDSSNNVVERPSTLERINMQLNSNTTTSLIFFQSLCARASEPYLRNLKQYACLLFCQ